MKEAMEQVKEALGRDAVILHTKKYKDGGFLGYRSKEIVEVTAAVEDENTPGTPKRKKAVPKEKETEGPPVPMPPPILPAKVLSQYKTHGTEQGVEIAAQGAAPVQSPVFPSFQGDAFGSMPPLPPDPMPSSLSAVPDPQEALPQNPPSEGNAVGKAPLPTEREEPPPSAESEKIQRLEDELARMKALLAQVMSKESQEGTVSLQEALRRQDVDKEILDDMAARSGAGETLADRKSTEAKATLQNYIQRVVKCSDGVQLAEHGSRVVALIGPTGVGKTTTLAKIAARFVLEQGISAALITADTYRISAVEQLKTYSDIIGLPIDIVYSPEELRKAIRKHEDKQLVLIDTAGRSQHNEYQMQELKELLKANSRIEKHLVISATTKSQDAADILEKFSACQPEHVIFTKVDETSSVGLVLNLLYEKDITLSYLAYGQSVPDDIMPASAEKLAELLLRE